MLLVSTGFVIRNVKLHHKARAATTRPTTPPERVIISLLRVRAAAAPVDWAASPEADSLADSTRIVSFCGSTEAGKIHGNIREASEPEVDDALLSDSSDEPVREAEPVEDASLPEPVVVSALLLFGDEAPVAPELAVATLPVGVPPLT